MKKESHKMTTKIKVCAVCESENIVGKQCAEDDYLDVCDDCGSVEQTKQISYPTDEPQ